MKKPEHAPLPWKLAKHWGGIICNADMKEIAQGSYAVEPLATEETARYIVHCVNTHGKLVEALAKIKHGVRHDTECCSVNGMSPYLCDCQRGNILTIITDALKLVRGDE